MYTVEYYSATKKNDLIPSAATWIQPESIILSKVSLEEKDKNHMMSLRCDALNMTQVNPFAKQKQNHRITDIHIRCAAAK